MTENPNFKIVDRSVEKIVLKNDYKKISKEEIHANFDEDQIINRLFKECFEKRQGCRIDGLSIEKDLYNENSLIAHRIQIKLDSSYIKDNEATRIIFQVKSQKKNFLKCFEATNKKISKCINYLVTTRGLDSSAMLGKTELCNKIWPECIKALGKPYK